LKGKLHLFLGGMKVTISRRNVLVQGAVIGAGILESNVSAIRALAAAAAPPLRKSLQGLAWNDPIVATYRDAVGKMKAMPESEKLNWVNLAKIHGSDPNDYHFCPHGNWYFLPWHRAYVVTYERIIRQLTKNPDFAMPYWDWTDNPTMPEVFVQPTTPDGKNNPLFVDDHFDGRTWRRTWPAKRPMPSDVVGRAVLNSILDTSFTFEQFGTSRPAGQDNLDQSWIVAQNQGVQGILEGNPHNNVHNNIGGWMPSAISPRDPIFFMHHSNIDRIWALWNSLGGPNSTDPLWTDMVFQNNFLNPDGTSYSPKVSELFDVEALGYTYGLTPAVASRGPALIGLEANLKVLMASPASPKAEGIQSFSVENSGGQVATPKQQLELSVKVPPALLQAVAKREAAGAGAELLNFQAAREVAASGTHVIGIIRDVATTDAESTLYRVFVNAENVTSETPIDDPHYVGSFGVFNHGKHAVGHANPSFAVSLTSALARTLGVTPGDGEQTVRVQILPVSNGTGGAVGTATVRSVDVAFVSS
jgi:tyrosinase